MCSRAVNIVTVQQHSRHKNGAQLSHNLVHYKCLKLSAFDYVKMFINIYQKYHQCVLIFIFSTRHYMQKSYVNSDLYVSPSLLHSSKSNVKLYRSFTRRYNHYGFRLDSREPFLLKSTWYFVWKRVWPEKRASSTRQHSFRVRCGIMYHVKRYHMKSYIL